MNFTAAMIIGTLVLAVVLHLAYKSYAKKLKKKNDREYQEYLADIAANPQNYFVSEGGTKPDPLPEENQGG